MSCKLLQQNELAADRSWRVRQIAGPAGAASEGLAPFPERRQFEKNLAETAKAELEQKIAEGYRKGVEEGRRQSAAEAEAQVAPLIRQLSQSAGVLASLKSKLRREAEQELLTLVLAVSRRVIHREVTLDPTSIIGVIRVALDRVSRSEMNAITTHPDMAARVREMLDLEGYSDLEVKTDQDLQIGDLLFHTQRGTLDATLDTQLAEIGRGLADRL